MAFPKLPIVGRDPVLLAGAAVGGFLLLDMFLHGTEGGTPVVKKQVAKNMHHLKKEHAKNQIKQHGPDDAIVNLADKVVSTARYWAKSGEMVETYRTDMEDHLLKHYKTDLENLQTLFRRAENSNIPADREAYIAATNHMAILMLNQWQIPVRDQDSSFDYGEGYVKGRARPYIQQNPALRDKLTVAEAHADDGALSYWSFAFPENKIPDLFTYGFRLSVA